tara:strand:+ start:1915 stop:2385 length:471 start_codon:yes stop_codon:yes gene_type:complete
MKKSPMRLKDREVLVNKIARGVEAENLKVLTKAIEKNRNYKTAKVYSLDVEILKDKRNELINKINEKERQIKDLVEKVNKALPIKQNENHYGFEVGLRYSTSNYDKYDGLAIVSEIGWTVKDTIMEEVSLATMDSYCQEDIFGIIEKLTAQFSGGK